MFTFPELIKKIREEANLTQSQFAEILEVSSVLIAMVETGQKEVSKSLIIKLADKMKVHPTSLTPFLFIDQNFNSNTKLNKVERMFINWGEEMQQILIKRRSKILKKYVRYTVSKIIHPK